MNPLKEAEASCRLDGETRCVEEGFANSPPPKLFENGPDWVATTWGWECRIADLFINIEEMVRHLGDGGRQYRGFSGIPGRYGELEPYSDPGTLEECVTWIRARLIVHRDELCRAMGDAC